MPNDPNQFNNIIKNQYALNNPADGQMNSMGYPMPPMPPTVTRMTQQSMSPNQTPTAHMTRTPQQPMQSTARQNVANQVVRQERAMECSMPLAMAWFQDQSIGNIYTPEYALERGTLFPELDMPWLAQKGGR